VCSKFTQRKIAQVAGIEKHINYHSSRHSFGTLAISAGLSIESIAKMMGHSNISTTQGYAQITEQKISEDMDRLIERRKKKGVNAASHQIFVISIFSTKFVD
jgi:site-specific recombinase XerD